MPSSAGVQTCARSEEHTSELQSHDNLVCRLLLEKKHRPAIPLPATRPPHPQCAQRTRLSDHYRVVSAVRVVEPAFAFFERRTPRIFFFNDTATTEIYALSLHDALPI